MPCYGVGGPFKYTDVFGDPVIEKMGRAFKLGFELGMDLEKEITQAILEELNEAASKSS